MPEDFVGQDIIHAPIDRSQEIRGVKKVAFKAGASPSEKWDRFTNRKKKHKRAKIIQAGIKVKSEGHQDTYIGDISIED